MGQKSGHGLAVSLRVKISHKTAIKVADGAVFISKLNWENHFQTHSCWVAGLRSSLAYWPETSVLCPTSPYPKGQLTTWQLPGSRSNERATECYLMWNHGLF